MDPVTHTLVGAALAETGLKRRTALGTATLLIGANLPDVDLLSFVAGSATALWFRRGVTHGVLGLVALPFALTGVMVLWDRLVRRRGRRDHDGSLVSGQILLLAAIAIASHPMLDFLNTYGMRWLMPFSDAWYFGDTLFIVDPWVWVVLTAGVFLARKRETGTGKRGAAPSASPPDRPTARSPAVTALLVMGVYIASMAISSIAARWIVTRSLTAAGLGVPTRLMVAPRAVDPFSKWVVIEDAGVFRFGSFRWFRSPKFTLDEYRYDRHPSHFAAAAATRGPEVRKFLSWARFPYSFVEERQDAYIVRLGDARYTLDPEGSWAGMTVVIEK